MPGTVVKLWFGRWGEGATALWLVTVNWHGPIPSTSRRWPANRLVKVKEIK